MVTYMRSPQVLINVGGIDYPNITMFADVTRVENGFDTATVTLTDYKSVNYPTVTADATIALYVKDQPDAAWGNPIFNGVIVYCTLGKAPETLVLKCDGAGYGLSRVLCGTEYGLESSLGAAYDTIHEILGDGTSDSGIIHAWVNHILGDTLGVTYPPSGYAYNTDNVDATIAGIIKYAMFPYKPANKCLDDLCDLLTAIRQGAVGHPDHDGAHWIVDTSSNIFLQSLNGTSANWPLYYGGTATTATLVEGTDLLTQSFEKMAIEANHIVYYGNWRRPGSGDAWTENSHLLWDHTAVDMEVDSVNNPKIVGGYSLRLNTPTGVGGYAWYPVGALPVLGWDITKISSPTHTPTLNFYFRRSAAVTTVNIGLWTDWANNFNYDFTADLTNANEFYHFSFPIGPYWDLDRDKTNFKWTDLGGDWTHINFISFIWSGPNTTYGYADGLYIGDVPLCRVAYNSTLVGTKKLKSKLIVDDVGKDDSLVRTDDSGTIAQMAHAELLRCQTMPTVGHITTPMIKDLLPGERLHIHAKLNSAGAYQVNDDMRVPRLTHHITPTGFTSEIDLTTDIINSHPRAAHNDLNAVLANTRPEFQDRSASSQKAGTVDINVPRWELDYP